MHSRRAMRVHAAKGGFGDKKKGAAPAEEVDEVVNAAPLTSPSHEGARWAARNVPLLAQLPTCRRGGASGCPLTGEKSECGCRQSKLSSELFEELKGTNFIVLGDNSQVNRNVATALAGAMRYTPIVTEDIVEKLIKMPLADLVAEEGDGGAY